MAQLALFTDDLCRRHNAGAGHPERPERLDAVASVFKEMLQRPGIREAEGRDATITELRRIHTGDHIRRLEESAARQFTVFDADTVTNNNSFAAALRAAGCACAAVDAVCTGAVQRAFVGTRPPGHHAEADRAMGFCLFNNVAVAAEQARKRYGLERVAIVDWDVHHGNGTMDSFYDDPGVLYISLHQSPLFPGTGRLEELGRDAGYGHTLNLPLSAGRSDTEYLYLFDQLIVPLLDRYRPELILISAGFDAHERDPLGSMLLSAEAFGAMTRRLVAVAERHGPGSVVAVLEGGYSLYGLELGVRATVSGLLLGGDAPGGAHTIVDSAVEALAERAAHALHAHWGALSR